MRPGMWALPFARKLSHRRCAARRRPPSHPGPARMANPSTLAGGDAMHLSWISRHRPDTARPSGRRPWRWLAAVAATACLAVTYAAAAAGGTAGPASAPALNCAPPGAKLSPCYSPQAYEVAYGVAPLLSRGIDGSGETVVIPERAQTPTSEGGPDDIRQDLARFDSEFGLPPAELRVV